MRRVTPTFVLAIVTLALAFSAPAHAASTALKQAYIVYQTNGKIPPCVLSAKTLKDALNSIPGDSEQYSPDFRDAIETAIQAAASGSCDKKSTPKTHTQAAAPVVAPTNTQPPSQGKTQSAPQHTTSTPAAVSTPAPVKTLSTPQPAPPVNPAPLVGDNAIPAAAINPASSGTDDAPAPLVVLAILLAVLAVLCGIWAAARYLGYDPPWLVRLRHSSQEAGWRASAAWSEFTDWVRLGR